MKDQGWPALGLARWPFQIVPDEHFTRLWADRQVLYEQLKRLVWRWNTQPRSTIHLLWADLGAGKTHTLRHVEWLMRQQADRALLPIYARMPKQLRSFVEVYRAIASSLDVDMLVRAYADAVRDAGGSSSLTRTAFRTLPDIVPMFVGLASHDQDVRQLATMWLQADRLTSRQARELRIASQIRGTDDAVAMLSGLVHILLRGGRYKRIVVMLDEFQRIGQFKLAIGRDINAALQTCFDSSPNGLSLVLSFGSGEEKFVRYLLSPEIQSREDRTHLALELMNREEVVQFVGDLLAASRFPSPAVDQFFPFSKDLVRDTANSITERGGVKPREIMAAFDAVLSEIAYRSDQGGATSLSEAEWRPLVLTAIGQLPSEEE